MARYGGEEFAMVMPHTEMRGAGAFAERFRKAVEMMEIPVNGRVIRLSASFGVAFYGSRSKKVTAGEILDIADKALYDAKNSGRNRVVTAIC